MFGLFKKNDDLDSHLNGRKVVLINDFSFIIKKIDILDYMANDSILLKVFDLYTNKRSAEMKNLPMEKVRQHYKQVICAGVVNPKVTYKDESEGICVDELFNDWDLTQKLYAEIIEYTVGKKKS